MSKVILSVLRPMGSHGVTLVLLGIIAVVVVVGLGGEISVDKWVALPLAGLLVNLIAALIAHGTLRTQPMLFAFHAMLGVLVALIALDDLTSLRGHVEVTEGAAFDPSLANVEVGPLHYSTLDGIDFVQGPFEIHYLPGMKRRDTVSFVSVPNALGDREEIAVGDDDPLVFGDYRFYTSFNKGFAPVISYTSASGETMSGAVHMPSYPLRDFDQGNAWTPPDGPPVMLWLSLPDPVYDPEESWVFRTPTDPVLVVIEDEIRQELRLGDAAMLSNGGSVRFERLHTWMGYTISYNPLMPWILAVSVTACIVLMVHIIERMRPVPAPIGAGGEAGNAC